MRSNISFPSSRKASAVSSDKPANIPYFKLRIIPYMQYSGRDNMAIDTYFARECHENAESIIRFYGWKPFCLSIGCHQNKNIVDLKSLQRNGFQYVRRPTGGRAIFHAQELTYSAIFPKNLLNHQSLYEFIHLLFFKTLRSLGYSVTIKETKSIMPRIKDQSYDFPCFTKSAYSELHYDGKKLMGSAQKILKHSILQHGSLLIGRAHEQLPEYLNESDENKRLIKLEIQRKTKCLNSVKSKRISPERIMKAVIKQLELNKTILLNFKDLLSSELKNARLIDIDSE
jgi:lipoate-protein ligase A